jgi:hypothetical protein
VGSLAAMIAALPDGSSARADAQMHAMRLTALLPTLLPKSVVSNQPSTNPISSIFPGDRRGLIRYVIFSMVLTIFLLVSQWLSERAPQNGHSGAAPPPATGTTVPR